MSDPQKPANGSPPQKRVYRVTLRNAHGKKKQSRVRAASADVIRSEYRGTEWAPEHIELEPETVPTPEPVSGTRVRPPTVVSAFVQSARAPFARERDDTKTNVDYETESWLTGLVLLAFPWFIIVIAPGRVLQNRSMDACVCMGFSVLGFILMPLTHAIYGACLVLGWIVMTLILGAVFGDFGPAESL